MNINVRTACGITMLAFLLLAGSAGAQGSASATSGNVGYSANVTCSQNTVIDFANGNFGTILQGGSAVLMPSVVLNNTGCNPAKVEARFDTSYNSLFGLISGNNDVLSAMNFYLGTTDPLPFLDGTGIDVPVATAPLGFSTLNATLSVPSTQTPGNYAGNVILTFSDAV